MPNDPVKRIAKWNAKFNTERVKATLDDLLPGMKSHVEAQFVSISSMEGQVKQTLDAVGVSVIQYPFYLDFGRELWHMTHQVEMSGESAAQEAAVLIAKWVARGLTQSVLEAVRTDVFSIGAPVGP